MTSLYDANIHKILRQEGIEELKRKYVEEELRDLENQGVNPYDLNHIFKITKAFREAEKMFN